MRKIVLPDYKKNILRAILSLQVVESEIPKPAKNEVLVKVHAAPCNPSDIAFMEGGYNIVKTLPAVPGLEGSGIVVDAGEGAENLIDEKVCFFSQDDRDGTWSEYICLNKKNLVVLDGQMDMDQAACFSINPFTARGLLDIALLHSVPCIIQNAAGGQVAAFVRQMAEEHNIKVIDIVRKKESADQLKKAGAKYVLLEHDQDFEEKLMKLSAKLEATLALDAVGGELTGKILNAMPEGSEIVIYGGLSNQPVSGINPLGLIFKDKIVSGFNLADWREMLDDDYFDEISKAMQARFIDNTYKTRIQSKTDFDHITSGLTNYLRQMSAGKILISPK
ncbi:MAG: zinc-binding dehydrogenase [Bacteroidales bacterium]|nr:zinc-binding dehydrogenase [Bacteroidales bacterium]